MMMEEGEVGKLRETIHHENVIMQKLYAELEEEREASATAASEALSMILRLQEEKAAEKMEACQYKRMAEEKMRHAEESLVIFEDLLYQKEMQIASLKLMVQDYMEKFSGMLSESEGNEMKFLENPHTKGSNSLLLEKSTNRLRRKSSLPVLLIKELCSQIDNIDRDVYSCRSSYSMQKRIEGLTDNFNKSATRECVASGCFHRSSMSSDKDVAGSSSCHSKQEEEVKEKFLDLQESVSNSSHTRNVAGDITAGGSSRNIFPKLTVDLAGKKEAFISSPTHPAISEKTYSLEKQEVESKIDVDATSNSSSKDSEFLLRDDEYDMPYVQTRSNADTSNSVNMHDIHEIPQIKKSIYEMQKFSLDDKNSSEPPNSMPKEATGYLGDGEHLRKPVLGSCCGINAYSSKKNVNPADLSWCGSSHNIDSPPVSNIEQFERRLRMIEEERKTMLCEGSLREKEQLKLLRDIHEQLNMMRYYLQEGESKKTSSRSTWIFDLLTEAMLSFSI